MQHRVYALLALSLLLSLLPLSPVRGEEIVVTASPLAGETPATVAGKSPTSFTQTVKVNPLARGLTGTLNALRLSGSVDLPEYGQSYLPSPLSLRGSKDQQTLIMLDGVPLSSSLGDPVDLSLFPVTDIDRIEIVKGSASATYGPSAMGGVVNIVTRNPAPENATEFTSSLGSFGNRLFNILLNRGSADGGFMAGITRSSGEGDYRYERPDGTELRRVNNDFESVSLLSKAWMDLSGWDTTLVGNLVTQELGNPGGEGYAGAYLTPDDRVNASQYFLALSTARQIDADRVLVFKASRIHNRTHNINDNAWVAGDSWTKLTSDFLELGYTGKAGRLTASPGFAWRGEGLSSDEYGVHRRSTTSGSLSTSLDLDPLTLTGAFRYDHSTRFDGHWTWQGGLLLNVAPHAKLKANAGTGYHEPTMGNLYSPSSFTLFVTNPGLRPEKSLGFDVGPEFQFEKFGFGAAYFLTAYDDLITWSYDEATNTSTCVNVDEARVSGIDSQAWVSPVNALKVSLGYVYSRFVNRSGPFESKTLPLKPGQIFTVRADLLPTVWGRPADLFLSYQFREGVYRDDANTEKTGNRNILDLGASLEVVPHAVAAFKVSNLRDDRTPEYASGDFWYPVPGRTCRASLQLTF